MKSTTICLLLAAACATLCSCRAETPFPPEVSEQLSAFQSDTKWLRDLPRPEGAIVTGFGGGAAADYRFWNIHVNGAASRGNVLAFYAGQLSGLGWRLLGDLQDEPVSIRSFRYLDEDDRAWHGLLVVADGVDEPGRVDVTIRVSRITQSVSSLGPEPNQGASDGPRASASPPALGR